MMLSGLVGEPAKVQHGKKDVRTNALDPDEGAYQLHESATVGLRLRESVSKFFDSVCRGNLD